MVKHVSITQKVIPLEVGWYILVYDPRYTNPDEIIRALNSVDENAPDCNFVMIPSFKPDSVRLLKTEIPVKLNNE